MEEHREKVHGLARMVMVTPVLMIKDSRDSAEVNDDKSVEIQEAIESAADIPREARKGSKIWKISGFQSEIQAAAHFLCFFH